MLTQVPGRTPRLRIALTEVFLGQQPEDKGCLERGRSLAKEPGPVNGRRSQLRCSRPRARAQSPVPPPRSQARRLSPSVLQLLSRTRGRRSRLEEVSPGDDHTCLTSSDIRGRHPSLHFCASHPCVIMAELRLSPMRIPSTCQRWKRSYPGVTPVIPARAPPSSLLRISARPPPP